MSDAPRRVDAVPPPLEPVPAGSYRYDPPSTPSAKARAPRIEVRRFAGPSAFVGRLDRLRIVHLTDLHFGRVTPMAVQREAVRLTNAEKPDLVVITGDFVCHSQLYLDQLVETLRDIEAPTMGVLGNHDHWSGSDEVRAALKRAEVQVLDNAHTVVTLRGQQLQVLGLDDAYTGHARRDDAVRGLRKDLPTLGLSHIAEEADALWQYGVPLVLSGHTHAGQVTFARLHELTLGRLAGHKYVHGLYGTRAAYDPQAGGAVYVGAGIGASVIPFRFGDRGRREVTVFELGQAPGSFDEHHPEQPPLRGRKPSEVVKAKRAAAVLKKREAREKRQNGKR